MANLPVYQPEADNTKCNLFVADFANTVFDCSTFDGLLANQIVLDALKLQNTFKPLYDRTKNLTDRTAAFQNAQSYANTGYLIVYGWYNNAGHGHVMVGVPGQLQHGWSGNEVPTVAQAGTLVSAAMKLSEGLSMEKGDSDSFVVYGWI